MHYIKNIAALVLFGKNTLKSSGSHFICYISILQDLFEFSTVLRLKAKDLRPGPKFRNIKLWTLLISGTSTKIKLRTHQNPPKILNFEPMNWVRLYTSIHFFSDQTLLLYFTLECLE